MPARLAKIPSMASSSKGRASSGKKSSAGKARVISTKRKDALPRTGSVSGGRKQPTSSRKKTTRAAGHAPAELSAPAIEAVEPPATAYEEFLVTALATPKGEPVAIVETELEVEASAIVEELPIEAVMAPSTAIGPPPIPEETRTPSLARTTAKRPAPAPPAPRPERRPLMPAIARLLTTLSRWTGVSGTKHPVSSGRGAGEPIQPPGASPPAS